MWSDAVTVCFGCGVGVTLVAALVLFLLHQWGDCCAFPPHPDSWEGRPEWTQPGTSDGDSAFLFSILMRLGVLGAMIAALVLDDWTSESLGSLKMTHAGVLSLRISLLGQSATVDYSSCNTHELWCILLRGGGIATLVAGILSCTYSTAGLARILCKSSFSSRSIHHFYQLDLLATVAASATCLFWSTVTHGMLVQFADGSSVSVDLSLSWFLAIGAAGAQLLLTSLYTRAVWKYEAKAMRDQERAVAVRPPRPAPYERRSIQLTAVVPMELALTASLADEQARRRAQEDEEFAAILTVKQMTAETGDA